MIIAAWCALLVPGQSASRPADAAVRWPVRPAYSRLLPDKISILEPIDAESSDEARTGLQSDAEVLIYAGGKLDSLEAASGRSRWARPQPLEQMPTFIAARPHRLVFATLHSVFALNRTTGAEVWRVGDEPDADPQRDPEALPQWARFAACGDRIFCASDHNQVIAIDLRNGQVLWRARTDEGVTHVAAGGRHVCCALGGTMRGRLLVFRADSGKRVRAIDQPDRPTIVNLTLASSDAIHVTTTTAWRRFKIDADRRTIDVPIDGACWYIKGLADASDRLLVCSRDGLRRILLTGERDTEMILACRPPATAQPWGMLRDGTLYISTGPRFSAYDPHAERLLWTRERTKTSASQPVFTRDTILFIQPHDNPDSGTSTRFHISGLLRTTGEPVAIAERPPLITPELASFGGLYVRRNALLILDDNLLIGYVGREERPTRASATSRPAAPARAQSTNDP